MSAVAKIPPKPSKETIYIDVDDEIISIVDKVENAKGQVLALVLPKRSTALKSIVNMRLLKKSADSVKKSIVLITSEYALLSLAGAAGLHVAKDLQSKPEIPPAPSQSTKPDQEAPAEGDKISFKGGAPSSEVANEGEEDLPIKIDYDKPIGELADGKDDEHPDIVEIEEGEDGGKLGKKPKKFNGNKIKVPNFDKFRILLALGVLGIIGLGVFIYLAIAVLPKATVSIQTTSTPVSATFNLTTSDKATAVDLTKNIIPASLKTSDQTLTEQVTATGQQNTGNKAKGSITMTAQECGTVKPAATVPAGSGVTSSGLIYITQSDVQFSSSGQVSGNCITYQATAATDIIAQNGGANYNGATSFVVAGRSDVTASASTATSGGTDSIQTILTQSDVDGAVQKISSSSSDNFSKTFQSQLSQQNLYVLASTLKLSDPSTSSSPAVGQATSTATVTVKITYSVLTIKLDDLKKAISDTVLAQVDKTKQKVEDSDIMKGATITVTNQASPTVVSLNIIETTSAVPILDQQAIVKQVEGLKVGDIQALLGNTTGVKSVNVKFSPFWVSKVPKKPAKINVVITHVSS